jgi:pantetheine-phosphate adenylyltransferase
MRIGLYAGSFDPPTLGHQDIIRRALAVVDRLVVAVAINSTKTPLFPIEQRAELLRRVTDDARVEVRDFRGLLVDLAHEVGATVLVRGVRGVADFEYEVQMARLNRGLAPTVETIFLAPSADVAHVSSTFVREIARLGGDVSPLVHPDVAAALRARYAQ